MKKSEREPELIRLWMQRPSEGRTMMGLIEFTCWLEREHPELLPPRRYGDPYQQLQSVLRGRIQGE